MADSIIDRLKETMKMMRDGYANAASIRAIHDAIHYLDRHTVDGYSEWLQMGMREQWCGNIVCATHETVYTDDEMEAFWNDGDDMCVFVVRLNGDSGERDGDDARIG